MDKAWPSLFQYTELKAEEHTEGNVSSVILLPSGDHTTEPHAFVFKQVGHNRDPKCLWVHELFLEGLRNVRKKIYSLSIVLDPKFSTPFLLENLTGQNIKEYW